MKDFVKQCSATAGAAFAGACCLGVPAALSLLAAIGAGFLVNDAFLLPLFFGLSALSVWLLYGSARTHRNLAPFWAGLAGALAAFGGLWVHAALVYGGLAALIGASFWDLRNARRAASPARGRA
jgi:mercuric ion transport protein